VTVTRDGRPVAELRPLRTRGLSAATLLERWHRLPMVDPAGLRREVDSVIDRGLTTGRRWTTAMRGAAMHAG
jgi:antitoxin (DNA-binding transcriptional repressor) of toxin-antitoxin stability system